MRTGDAGSYRPMAAKFRLASNTTARSPAAPPEPSPPVIERDRVAEHPGVPGAYVA